MILELFLGFLRVLLRKFVLLHLMNGFLNFSILEPELLNVKLVFLKGAEDFNNVLVHLP